MRTLNFLVAILLCLFLVIPADAQALNKKVSLEYKEMAVEQVLKDISKKYGVKFSYSSNIIALSKKISITVNEKPLSYVLDKIFAGMNVSYSEVGSQIVLARAKQGTVSPKKAATSTEKLILEDTAAQEKETAEVPAAFMDAVPAEVKSDTVVFFQTPVYTTASFKDTVDRQMLKRQYLLDKRKLRNQYYHQLDSIERSSDVKPSRDLKEDFRRAARRLKRELEAIGDTLQNMNWRTKDSSDKKQKDSLTTNRDDKKEESKGYIHRPGQITFVSPLGTNGVESPRVVNNVSFNILSGVSAGTEGFELGGLVNVDRDYVHGTQVAGLGNVVGRDAMGGQISGLFNINGGYTQGFQGSGFMNIVTDSVYAVQAAGFMNLVSEDVQGGQFSGFTNMAKGNMYGAQGAGFLNVAGGDAYGAQVAGFMNVAGRNVRGVQVAGFMNVAPDTLKGAQVAGFMNVGRKVIGSQIGVFNIADSVTGVQVGFFSFSRKGYHKLEVWGGESFYGNLAFKTGTSHFYNIFAAGIRPRNNELTWGFGYGVGSEFKLTPKLLLSTDALAYSIHKNGFDWNELNLLNQFRLNLGFRLGPKASIFAGPVFNVMVSNHYDPDTRTYGSDIVPAGAFFNQTYNGTNVAMWIGANAGIRF